MSSQTLPVVLTTALVIGGERMMQRQSDTRSDVRDLRNRVGDAEANIDDVILSGDWKRLRSHRVRDILTGLAYPHEAVTENSATFATTPVTIDRPVLHEDLVTEDEGYPGNTNQYSPNGQLLHPSEAFTGRNFALGLAMGFGENRATTIGGTMESVPTNDELIRIFRHNRGLMRVLRELSALSQGQSEDAWRRFFGAAATGHDTKVLWRLLEDSPSLSVVGTGTFLSFVLPAKSLNVGDVAILRFSPRIPAGSVNSNFTPKVLVGAVELWKPYGPMNAAAAGLANASNAPVEVRITRRPDDSSGGHHFAVSGSLVYGTDSVAGAIGSGGLPVVGFDHNVDQTISITGTFSAAMTTFITEGSLTRFV